MAGSRGRWRRQRANAVEGAPEEAPSRPRAWVIHRMASGPGSMAIGAKLLKAVLVIAPGGEHPPRR